MKTKKSLILASLIALILSACGAEATATPSQEELLNEVYTVVAMTNAAAATPTPQSMPTASLIPTVTLISSLPTATLFKSVVNPTSVSSCDSSMYLSDVTIPDGTVLEPDEEFTKTWSLQNTGTCAWTTSYSLIYYSGNSMSGSATALASAVSSGGNISVSVDLVAPSTAGSYTGYWRLQNASGVSFGEAVYVQITVAGSTSTPTATEEDESTSTPTTEPTETPIPTETPEPTATSA
jgi:hypothetical protein